MKPLSERNPIAIAIAGLVLMGLLAFAVFDSANLPIIGGGTGYTAYFAEAAGLQAGNEVRVAGVIVGRVTGISLAGNKVAVNFKVKGAWVGNDTQAAIKIKTLLGDKYLALKPLGNGRWFDTYLCGLIPKSYLPPGTGPSTGCEPPKP